MKIAIIGTRGIPNNYGGLEQFAEKVSELLVSKFAHEVIVYNPTYHPYSEATFNGVKIIRKNNPEKKIGTPGNFIYDYRCLKDAVHENCDVILACGYATQVWCYPFVSFGKSKIATNIDGMEWWRSKWTYFVKFFVKYFEKIAVNYSHAIVADNKAIQEYVMERYHKESYCIAYAADKNDTNNESSLLKFGLTKYNYNVLICRLEIENNIETILDGVVLAKSKMDTLVFANYENSYGKYLIEKYSEHKNVKFMGWVGGQTILNDVRHFACLYFHGHSVGGTNPSLLEAMAGGAFIAAHDNKFNRYVTGQDALYFKTPQDVANLIDDYDSISMVKDLFLNNNKHKIDTIYNWDEIAKEYHNMFVDMLKK